MSKTTIDIECINDMNYWTKELNVTEQDLSVAVLMVGNELEKVVAYIKEHCS